jgi:acetyltransferase EpsM
MTIDLVLVGCGEHATVVADAALSREGTWRLVGYTDLVPSAAAAKRAGVAFLGTDDAYLDRFVPKDGVAFILGLAGTTVSPARGKLARMYEDKGATFARITHAAAWVSPSARVEDGAVIMAGAIVNSGARIGRHAIVNSGAIVEHDVDIGAFASVSPGAVIGGGARIGEGCYIGLGASVRDHIVIGARTMVAMGAVVVGDVADDSVVMGVPARPRAPKGATR